MTRFEKMEGYPEEIQGRFNSFITTQFDDSLSVEMQIRSLIKWINSSRELINDIVDYINLFIEMFDERLQEEIVGRLNEWLADGTLAKIINNDVFDMKADKIFVDSEIGRLEQKDEDLTTHIDSEIGRLDQKDEDLTTHIDSLEQNKRNKGESILFSVDFKKQSNETDDKFINRLLRSLPDEQGTVVLDGTYQLEDSIVLTPYQTLQGTGQNTNLMMINNNKNIIELEARTSEYVYGVKILNLSIHGNLTNTGIHLKKCSHLKIEDVYIYETGWGIWADSAWLAQYDRVTVRNYESMGNYGITIKAGTSNLFNNVWVKNFKGGYNVESMYSTFNSSACDTFTEYAYWVGQASTLNSCGAEDGQLITDGFIFGAGARSVVLNACETMNIAYTGSKDNASIFYFYGSNATVNNYSHSGSLALPENASLVMLRGGSYTNFVNARMGSGHSGTQFNFDKYNATASVLFEQQGARFTVHRWNGSKDFVTE